MESSADYAGGDFLGLPLRFGDKQSFVDNEVAPDLGDSLVSASGVVETLAGGAALEPEGGDALPLVSVAFAVHESDPLSLSVQFGEPSAHRNVVPELVRHIQDSSVVFDVSGESALKPAGRSALALFAVTFGVHDKTGAGCGDRTRDLMITNQLLVPLS